MKKLLCTLCMLALLIGMLGSLPVAAAGSMTATASASTVTVGSTVTITVKYNGGGAAIGGLQSVLTYNAAAFDYTGCSGIEANGGAGTLKMVWYASGSTAPSTVSYTVTFKAKAPGAGNFALATTEFFDDATYASLGTPSKTLAISATNPTLSGNANLKSLRPSAGTLTPAFNAGTTAYSITVPYTVTSLSLSAIAAHSNAKVEISGSNALKVGKNTQTVTVTAPNGTTKKYTVTITRSANQTTDPPSSGSTTTTTAPPEEDPLEVEVDGTLMTVADTQPDATLPLGYAWEPIELNGVMVSAAKNADSGLTLLYLRGKTAQDNAFYIYEDDSFTRFDPLVSDAALYVLLPMPQDQRAPQDTTAAEIEIGDKTVSGYTFTDTALTDIALIYAVGPTGYTGLHVYDKTDGSIQRYRALTESAPVDNEPDKPAQHPIIVWITDHRTLLLIAAAGVGAIGLLIIAVVLIIRLCKRPSNARH